MIEFILFLIKTNHFLMFYNKVFSASCHCLQTALHVRRALHAAIGRASLLTALPVIHVLHSSLSDGGSLPVIGFRALPISLMGLISPISPRQARGSCFRIMPLLTIGASCPQGVSCGHCPRFIVHSALADHAPSHQFARLSDLSRQNSAFRS